MFKIFIVQAANNAKEVGRQVGKFIQTSNIDPMLVHCIGGILVMKKNNYYIYIFFYFFIKGILWVRTHAVNI